MDTVTPETRSKIMSRVRGRDTGPELTVRRLLHTHGYRFRLHRRDLPGRPDIYLPKYRTSIFVHGCFWHGHAGCRRATVPETRADFWRAKIATNQARDQGAIRDSAELGLKVVTLWQCELKDQDEVLRRVAEATGRSSGKHNV